MAVIKSLRKSRSVPSVRSSRKCDAKSGNDGTTEELVDLQKSACIMAKQTELDGILDKHDSLVREAFHMERFVSLVAYDPKVAKQDNSNVFQEYKASRYDIVEKVNPTSTSIVSPRKTRRAHTEHLQQLKGDSASTPTAPISAKSKGKSSGLHSENDDIWNILASAKGKGKAKESSLGSSSMRGKGNGGDLQSISAVHREKGKGRSTSFHASSHVSPLGHPSGSKLSASSVSAPSIRPRKRPPESISMNGHPSVLESSRKRRKVDSLDDDGLPFLNAAVPSPNGKGYPGRDRGLPPEKKSRVMPSRNATRTADSRLPPKKDHATVKPSMKTTIKRIKLLVRPPPPLFSNPRQRPLPAKYGPSLPAFMDSYLTLDFNDITPEMMEETAKTDAGIRERIDSFRRQGRLLLGTDLLSSSPTPKRSPDQWDIIVESIITRGPRRTNGGKIIAKQVAQKIQAYWDGFAQREDKAKMQEEKRLRVLAKTTLRAIIDQWKRAAAYVRNEEKQLLEAEERRKGHEHLDAILDQSGQILETQQGDLTRGDISGPISRSSSISLTTLNWGSNDYRDANDEEEEEDEEEDEDEEDGDGDEEGKGDDDDDDEDEDVIARAVSDANDSDRDTVPGEVESGAELRADLSLDDEDSAIELDRDVPLTPGSPDSIAVEELAMAYSSPSPPSSPSAGATNPSMNNASDSAMTSPDPFLQPPDLETSVHPSLEFNANDVRGDVSVQPTADIGVSSPEHDQAIQEVASTPSDAGSQPEMKSHPGRHFIPNVIPNRQPSFQVGDDALLYSTEDHMQSDAIVDVDSLITPLTGEAVSGVSLVTRNEAGVREEEEGKEGIKHTSQLDSHADLEATSGTGPSHEINEMDEAVIEAEEAEVDESHRIPDYLKPFAVAPVEWDPESKVKPPLLLRGILRPYQQSGLEWLASLHTNNLNGILADEMGLGKTIQTISLLAHLACDRGIWGPHLIVVPTSVLLNWEMEFKKFLPGFKILSYHGSTKRRKELRHGWNDRQHFNVCITSYTLASRDAHIFKRKAWYYMVLDEAHMIKNFKSQRWNILLMFRSFRRLLLTGTPLQNNLTELWALLQFLMSGTNFANLKEFGDWFSNPLEKAIEMGTMLDDETLQRVSKLHTVLRPYLLRRLKRDVEKELPSKYDHLVLCPLSKRQRFLYDEFMSRAQTHDALQSGIYQRIANVLMQLRKVCNHPDLFEVRPIVTSFSMERAAIADFEIQELLIRRRFVLEERESLNLNVLGLRFIDHQDTSAVNALETRRLDATFHLPFIFERAGEPPPTDTRSISGFRAYKAHQQRAQTISRWSQIGYLNRLRCQASPIYSQEAIGIAKRFYRPLLPLSAVDKRTPFPETAELISGAIKSYAYREHEMASIVDKFTFVTPAVVARDLPRISLSGTEEIVMDTLQDLSFDTVLHRAAVKLQIAFPDPSLLQYDCGKLQELTRLLREKKAGGHRVLIFTQMTKILDILEIFLNFHGYLYLRLDGATKIEDRQYVTERFNADPRVFCFIASSRSGGVGINLTGADTVVFYDSDFNPQMDRQCEDRAHRIGQIRDVHVYRFISQHTVEEAMLRKANQKRSLDDLVIQKGEFDWRSLFGDDSALTNALGEFEDKEDAHAAAVAAREEVVNQRDDEADFGAEADGDIGEVNSLTVEANPHDGKLATSGVIEDEEGPDDDEGVEDGGTVAEYMISFIRRDPDFFREWRL